MGSELASSGRTKAASTLRSAARTPKQRGSSDAMTWRRVESVALQQTHVRTPLRSGQDFSEHIAGHIGEAIAASVVEEGQSLVIHPEQMEHGGDRVHSHDPSRLCSRGDEASNALENARFGSLRSGPSYLGSCFSDTL